MERTGGFAFDEALPAFGDAALLCELLHRRHGRATTRAAEKIAQVTNGLATHAAEGALDLLVEFAAVFARLRLTLDGASGEFESTQGIGA